MNNLKHQVKALSLLAITAWGQELLMTWEGSWLTDSFYREERGGCLRRRGKPEGAGGQCLGKEWATSSTSKISLLGQSGQGPAPEFLLLSPIGFWTPQRLLP